MKKIKSIVYFTYGNQLGVIGSSDNKNEFSLNDNIYKGHGQLIIKFYPYENEEVVLSTSEYPRTYKTFTFNNSFFTNAQIIELSKLFRFDVIPSIYYPNELKASLGFIHKDYKYIDSVIKEHEGTDYLIIYASRRSKPTHGASDDMDDTFYVHGIWEVELSEEFKDKLFKSNEIKITSILFNGKYMFKSANQEISIQFFENGTFKKESIENDSIQEIIGTYSLDNYLIQCDYYIGGKTTSFYLNLAKSEEITDSEIRKYYFEKHCW